MTPARRAHTLDDPIWLRRQYVDLARPVSDIAVDVGRDPANVYRALHRHGIELRGHPDRRDDWATTLTKRRLTALWARHETINGVAGELGCDHGTAREWLIRRGVIDVVVDGAAELRQLYEADGQSIGQIAAQLGVSPRTVRRRLIAARIPLRPRGRRAGRDGGGDGGGRHERGR